MAKYFLTGKKFGTVEQVFIAKYQKGKDTVFVSMKEGKVYDLNAAQVAALPIGAAYTGMFTTSDNPVPSTP